MMAFEEYRFTFEHRMYSDGSYFQLEEPIVFTYAADRSMSNNEAIMLNEVFERCKQEMLQRISKGDR